MIRWLLPSSTLPLATLALALLVPALAPGAAPLSAGLAQAQDSAGELGSPAPRDPDAALTPAPGAATRLGGSDPTRDPATRDPATRDPEPSRAGDAPPPPPPPPPGTAPIPEPPGLDRPATESRYPTGEGAAARSLARTDNGAAIPSRLATRIRVLDANLQALGARGGNRILDGVLSSLSGVLSIVLGFYVEEPMDTYLWVWGAAGIARGVLDLSLSPNAQEPALVYSNMPMATLGDVEARLEYGERSLERIARRTRTMRIIDSSISILAGISVVPIFLGPNDFQVDDPLDYFILIGSGISVISGLISLATRSEAERRWNAYRSVRDRLAEEEAGGPISDEDRAEALAPQTPRGLRFAGIGAAPVPGGGAASLTATF